MKYLTTLFLFLFSTGFLFGQEEDDNLIYEDYVYLDGIKSVKFSTGGLARNYPILQLNSNSRLVLTFDEISDEVKDYLYTFVHCDYDWKPSDISDMDYIDGFTEEDIDDFDYSFGTLANYTNYRLELPNRDMRWTKSGNYLLKIYDNTDDKTLAITRRFVVVDQKVSINPALRRPANVSKSRTHHEIDFTINHKEFPIRNPQIDIKIVVMQNGRWSTAIKNIKPLFVKPEQLIYDYQNKITFPAGKEFRYADIRTFEFRTNSIEDIVETRERFDVTLFKDLSRSGKGYLWQEDLNGKFIIESMEERDADLRAEYGHILFTLDENPAFENHDVYLYGEFTDWRIDDRYKLTYNSLISAYVAKLFLKQGFYNYVYALVDKKTKAIDLEELEGDWHETENDYTILVYYSPFGARYDQLIGSAVINSLR